MNSHSADRIFQIYTQRVLPFADVGIRVKDASLQVWLYYLFQSFGEVAGLRILDFGAASGHKAMLFSVLGAHAIAVDIAAEAIKRMQNAREASGLHFEVVQGDISALEAFAADSFDRILCSEVIEHIPENILLRFCNSIERVLKPGGIMFLTTPNYEVYGPAECSPEYYQNTPYGHYKHYRLDELQTLLDQSSLRVNNSWFQCHPLTRVRNRIFYPIAIYDNAIYISRRYPVLRWLLRPFSWLYHFFMTRRFNYQVQL